MDLLTGRLAAGVTAHRRRVALGGLLAALLGCAACSASGRSAVGPERDTTWTLVTRTALPRGGHPSQLAGSGRYRTFDWVTRGSAAHQWGLVDLTTGRTVLSTADPCHTVSSNGSTGSRVVHVLSDPVPGQEVGPYTITTQALPSGPEQQVDAVADPTPFDRPPSMAVVGDQVVWSRRDPACRCHRLMAAAVRSDGSLAAPRVLEQRTQDVQLRSDGSRLLVVSDDASVLDVTSGRRVSLPSLTVLSGAVLGQTVALLEGTHEGGEASADVDVFRVSGSSRRRLQQWTVPVAADRVDLVDGSRVLLSGGGVDSVLDLRSGAVSDLPIEDVDAGAGVATGDGTLTLATSSHGRSWLAVYRPTDAVPTGTTATPEPSGSG